MSEGGDPRFVVVGDVMSDFVVVPRGPLRHDTDTPATIRPRPGGSGANTAAWLGVLGRRVDFVGAIGSDAVPQHEAAFRDAGVEPHLTVEPGIPTGVLIITVDGNERSMLTDRGANALQRPERVGDELLAGAAVLHLSGYSITGAFGAAGAEELIRRARALGVAVSVSAGSASFIGDFGAEAFLEAIAGADVLLANLQEGRLLSGRDEPEAAAAALLERFPVVAVTAGPRGSVVADRRTPPRAVPAHAVRLLDPSGAGDAYAAGFLSSWAEGRDVAAAAELGTFTAARAVVVHGGRPPV